MPGTAAGFFGKLPSAGDFVQRRLPASFVDAWDQHFEAAVAESRRELGAAWHDAYHASPVWRFLLGAGVCGDAAWAGVIGPGADRVGRCFPMVIAAPLPPGPMECGEVLQAAGGWYDTVELAHARAQASASITVDAFDQQVAALGAPLDGGHTDPGSDLHLVEWARADHWRMPWPWPAQALSKRLGEVWMRLASTPGSWCLWWSAGGARVPPSMLVTRGLPRPAAYAGFLDAGCSGAVWQSIGEFQSPAVVFQPDMQPVEIRTALLTEPSPVTAWLPEDPELLADLVGLPAAPAPAALAPAATTITVPDAAGGETGNHVAVLHRRDCALTLVAAEVGDCDVRQRAVAAVRAIGHALSADEVASGMQLLRTRIMALNPQVRRSGEDLVNPVVEDCAVIAARVSDGQVELLRIGTAAAWHWRHGRLQPFFAKSNAPPAADAGLDGDIDDLLFSSVSLTAPGLGATVQPTCGEVFCAVNPGDRLLLVASQRLVQLPPEILARSLAMASCDDARQRIATAAGLDMHPADWPLAIIEIGA